MSTSTLTNSEESARPPADKPARKGRFERAAVERLLIFAVSLLATTHVVWFYVNKLPTYLDIPVYEQGAERMPFQGRMLLMYPLRWAHDSPALNALGAWITNEKFYLPGIVHPEDLVEFVIGFFAVVVAGMVARDMYRFHSKSGRLLPYVYPLFLVMVAGAYCLLTTHFFAYVYDLLSLGLFACGLYLIYQRRSPLLFALLFVVATINRETSLFLLPFFVLTNCVVDEKFVWQRALSWRVAVTTTVLGAFWIGWHVWVGRHFAHNGSESLPRFHDNMVALMSPFLRAQIFGLAAYTLPIVLIFKSKTRNMELRLWVWVIALWAVFMLFYGVIMEIRLFGELIPLFVCLSVMMAEERILAGTNAEPPAT